MGPEKEKYATWLDDIKELIMKKRAENIALKKVRESLESGGTGDAIAATSLSDEDKIQSFMDEDQSVNNYPININLKQ